MIGKRINQFRAMGLGLLALLIAICSSTLLFLLEPLPLQVLRNATFDQYQRWQPRDIRDSPVRIVDIDETSLQRLGQWPWPRTRMAELVTRLQQAQAAAIVFDIVFAEPDRTSPQTILNLWQVPANTRQQLSHLPDHDQVLAKTLSHGGVVLGFALDRPPAPSAAPAAKGRYAMLGASALPFLHAFTGATAPLPALINATTGLGTITFIPDADGIVRKVPLLVRQGDTLQPSLFAEALRVAQGVQNYTVRTAANIGLSEVRIGQLVVPTTARGEVWVHYAADPKRTIPAWQILAGLVPPEQMAGKIMLIGASAQGLMDQRFSPLGGVIPGVDIHAQAIEQTLMGDEITRPHWATALETTVIVCGSLLVALIALGCGAARATALFALLLAGLELAGWLAFSRYGLLLNPVTPGLALVLVFVLASIVRHLSSERRQRWVKQAFSRYVSPNLVEHLVAHPDTLELGGRRQPCSFIFTDLAGFTGLMESMNPAEAVALLNDYLDQMIAIAFTHHGTLDRIVGDAVAIMFSAPVPQTDHQRRALRCALEMHRFATQYVADLHIRGIAFGQTRIGVHSGEVIVGNFGGKTIFDYRALGDAVNTASRLEGANKYLGTLICVSEATLAGCPGQIARPIGHLLLKGKTVPLMVFEPMETTAPDVAYQTAFELLQNGAIEARAMFEKLAIERPHDPLVKLHLTRLRDGEHGDLIVLTGK